jgi:hypothetical protein
VVTSFIVTGTLPTGLQASNAATAPAAGTLPQSTVISAGTPIKLGPVISCTLMVCKQVVLLPTASVAVHVLLIV